MSDFAASYVSLCSCPVNLRSFASWSPIPYTPHAYQQTNGVCVDTPGTAFFFAESGVPRANAVPTSTMYRYYEELIKHLRAASYLSASTNACPSLLDASGIVNPTATTYKARPHTVAGCTRRRDKMSYRINAA